MTKLKAIFGLVGLAIVVGTVGGCSSLGNAAAGPDEATIKKNEESLPPQKQIELVQSSPMPADQKKAKIAEIEQKYNIKADDTKKPGSTP